MAVIKKESSGAKTGDGIIYSGPCFYYGFVCVTGGSDRAVVIYDNSSAAGKAVETYTCDGNKTTDGHSHSKPIHCRIGLYLDCPGAGETVTVYYAPY